MPDIGQLEENIVTFEDLLHITVTEFSNKVYLVEVLKSLTFGDTHLKHVNNIRVTTVL